MYSPTMSLRSYAYGCYTDHLESGFSQHFGPTGSELLVLLAAVAAALQQHCWQPATRRLLVSESLVSRAAW